MAKKKDKEELEQIEGKAIKNAKSLQEKQAEEAEKMQAQLDASIGGFLGNLFRYLVVKDNLLIEHVPSLIIDSWKILTVEEIKEIYEKEVENEKGVIHKGKKEGIGMIDDLFTLSELTNILEADKRMEEGKDADGNPLEIDENKVLLVRCTMKDLSRLKLVGTLRVPKGINNVIWGYSEKYLNA